MNLDPSPGLDWQTGGRAANMNALTGQISIEQRRLKAIAGADYHG
ncbi:hypothetical protein [Pseudomonas oryzicola]|nr:hypothetical protein [Pseudomonas oryzicola]